MTLACPRRQHLRWLIVAGLSCLLFVALGTVAYAAQGDNSTCLGCHSTAGLSTQLSGGDTLSLTVDPQVYNASVHGVQSMQCTACHTNITGYPHPKLTATDRRDFQMERYTQCKTCHEEQYREALDSNHQRELAAGNRNAPICTDCHGAHDIQKPDVPPQRVSTTCQKCHSTIYKDYASSVHGAAMQVGNTDVPMCTDCHGAHTQEDPTTVAFRLNSPKICETCHGDAALMQKYGISTEVFNTYVADFHGSTVTLFEKQHPDQETNKAVCTDCHGIHNISQVTAANASVVKENLLTTCRRCHPDATANFPDSWVGHFQPTREHYPLVYYVNLFYRILIPAVIGAMALFVVLDAIRRIINRFQRKGA